MIYYEPILKTFISDGNSLQTIYNRLHPHDSSVRTKHKIFLQLKVHSLSLTGYIVLRYLNLEISSYSRWLQWTQAAYQRAVHFQRSSSFCAWYLHVLKQFLHAATDTKHDSIWNFWSSRIFQIGIYNWNHWFITSIPVFTHWPPRDVTVISKVQFWNSFYEFTFYEFISWALPAKLLSGEYQITSWW